MTISSKFWLFSIQAEQLEKHYGDDRIKLFFAKILSSFLVGCAVIMLFFLVVLTLLDTNFLDQRTTTVFLPLQVGMLVLFLAAYSLLLNGYYNVGRSVFVIVVIASTISSVFLTGGFPKSPATPCLLLPSIFVYMLYGSKAGIRTAILVPIVVFSQWAIVEMTRLTLPDFTSDVSPSANVVLTMFVTYCVAISVVAVYQYQNRVLREELADERSNLAILADKDSLTGLFNSRYFHTELENCMKAEFTSNIQPSLVYLDLDNFKPINDGYGHQVGDEVLQLVAERMQNFVCGTGIIARMGGDEFAILVKMTADEGEVGKLCSGLRHLISEPIILKGVTHQVGASIGYSMIFGNKENAQDWLQRADQAMYHDKRNKVARQVIFKQIDLPFPAQRDVTQAA